MDPDSYKVHSWSQGGFLDALAAFAHCHGVKVHERLDFGMCQTLSLRWIQLKLQEVQQHQRADSATRMGQMTNSFFEAASISVKEETPFAIEARKSYRLREIAYPANGANADSIAGIVTQRRHSCYMAILQPRDEKEQEMEGLHAIAMYQSSGKIFGINKHVYIFDPNEGEYKVDSNSFGEWLKAFLSKHYNAQNFQGISGYSLG